MTETLKRAALVSPCGTYRYRLWRGWDAQRPSLPFVMLNPSTADANIDDPTIRRCMSFARRDGYGGIEVLNLYAYRTTDPRRLFFASDAVGPDNFRHLDALADYSVRSGVPIVCAWGTKGERGVYTADRMQRLGAKLLALGLTKHGHPRHPLYVRGDAPLIEIDADLSGLRARASQ